MVFELCQAFFELNAPTACGLRGETLSGTWQALTSGKADIALGGAFETGSIAGAQLAGIQVKANLGDMPFVFAVAPRHPLAKCPSRFRRAKSRKYRVVAVADSTSVATA